MWDSLNKQRDRLCLVAAMFDHLLRGRGVCHRKSIYAYDPIADVESVMEIGMIALLPTRNPYLDGESRFIEIRQLQVAKYCHVTQIIYSLHRDV